MQVSIDRNRRHVLLTGPGYQIALTWSQAALLATELNEKSREVEPPPPRGRSYHTKVER